ncbi:Leo1-like protein-domain-containing protein [Haematococcus lacustris]
MVFAELFGSDEEDEPQRDEQQALEDPDAATTEAPADAELEDDLGPGDGEHQQQNPDSNSGSDDDGKRRRQLAPPMELDAPLIPIPDASTICLLRTTNVVAMQPRPFDPATFYEEDTCLDASGRHRVPRPVEAVIRWRIRQLPDGRQVRESNARFVRWEDGSMQLLLGDEVLDLPERDITDTNQYLFSLTGVIQGQAPLTRQLNMRPMSVDSGIHKKVQEYVGKRTDKAQKVARHGGLQNPERAHRQLEAAVEERNRSKLNLARKQDRVMSRAYGGAQLRPGASRLTDSYLDEDQDYEDEGRGYDYDDGLSVEQRARMAQARSRSAEAVEAEGSRRLQAGKRGGAPPGPGLPDRGKRRRVDESEEEEEEEEYQDSEEGSEEAAAEEDEEEEYRSSSKASKKGQAAGGPAHGLAPERGMGRNTTVAQLSSAAAANRAKARRGVVLSDEEDE